MSKERDIQILEHKIADLEMKIANFEKFGIGDKKKQNLIMLKLRCEDELTALELT
jgi:hypothetical protein